LSAAYRAEQADDAGRVGIGGVEHMAADLGVEVDPLDLDEARLVVRKAGAGDSARQMLVFTVSLM